MHYRGQILTLVCLAAMTTPLIVQERQPRSSGQSLRDAGDETGPYDVVADWQKPVREGWFLYSNSVFAESTDRIVIGSAGERPIPSTPLTPPVPGWNLVGSPTAWDSKAPDAHEVHKVIILDRNGKKVDDWSQWDKVINQPHKLRISPYDPDKHVWVNDRDGEQILKFTNDGKRLVMTVGERGVTGSDDKHFNQNADLTFLPDGSFLVADGYVNSRIAKFDKNGKFLKAWGSKGTGPGQFDLVHGVATDGGGRVYVADRDNNRIQVFDENGAYLDQWAVRGPSDLLVTNDQALWVLAGATNRLIKYDLHGKLLTYWGIQGTWPGAFSDPHQMSVDAKGNLYIADWRNARVQKFTPKANAPRSRLVGQPYVHK